MVHKLLSLYMIVPVYIHVGVSLMAMNFMQIHREKLLIFLVHKKDVYVVLYFYPWFKFYFPWGVVIYDNEFKQRETKFKPRIKLNHNI